MLKKTTAILLTGIVLAASLTACQKTGKQLDNDAGNDEKKTIIEMELAEDYDDKEPFVNESLFYVTDDAEALELDISFQLTGESGLLEIADNNTGEILWGNEWNGNIENTSMTATLDFRKDKEYVVRLRGTKITYAKAAILSDSDRIKERSRPFGAAAEENSESDITEQASDAANTCKYRNNVGISGNTANAEGIRPERASTTNNK